MLWRLNFSSIAHEFIEQYQSQTKIQKQPLPTRTCSNTDIGFLDSFGFAKRISAIFRMERLLRDVYNEELGSSNRGLDDVGLINRDAIDLRTGGDVDIIENLDGSNEGE